MVKVADDKQVVVPPKERLDIEEGTPVEVKPKEECNKSKKATTHIQSGHDYGRWGAREVLFALLAFVAVVLVIGLSVGLTRNPQDSSSSSQTQLKHDSNDLLKDVATLLIVSGDVLTMNRNMDILSNKAIYINEGIIEEIGDADELRSKYSPDFTVELHEHDIVFPGLINTHGHVCMTAFGDMADDKELDEWLFSYIFPLEAALVTEEFCSTAVTLGVAEMLQGGTTTFVDAYFFQDEMAHLVKGLGIRAVLCENVVDFPQPDFATPEETFGYIEAFLQNWQEDDFITPCILPHAPYTTSPWIYKKNVDLVQKYGGLLSTHLAEGPSENQTTQERYGKSPTEYLQDNGFLTPNTILAHAVWLSDSDRTLIHDSGAFIAHNPTSNLKLANGIFDREAAKKAGLKLSQGTDGPASNNDLDMIEEMRLASLLAKGSGLLPTSASAKEVLYSSTMGGAMAIGREDDLGSIEVGKRADIAIIKRANHMKLYPAYDPYSAIVYSSNGHDVFATIVNGKILYYDGKLINIDEANLRNEVSLIAEQVKGKLVEIEAGAK